MEESEEYKNFVESQPISEEQENFNNLSKNDKLDRLNTLVKKSQIYSQIILENILENTLNKKRKREEQDKSSKSQKTGKKSKKSKSKDVLSMLSSDLTKLKRTESNLMSQPKLVSGGKMKEYQLEGLEWLSTLYENGLNGILADEMGLGKTLQCIAFISFLMENGIEGPFLIVAPLSTVSNWINEFSKFAPKIRTLKYAGVKDERKKIKKLDSYNVIITSYELSIRDFAKLNRVPDWKFLIVDEGHRLKNFNCLLIKVLKKLNVTNRLLITGTPLQNNLNELWSLLNFILPDIFHDLELFEQWFNFNELVNLKKNTKDEGDKQLIEVNIQENLVKNLHTILKPFILRRVKKDVMKDLPPKKEYLIHIPLSNLQKKIYNDAMNGTLGRGLVEVYLKEFMHYNHPDVFDDMDVIDAYVNKRFDYTTRSDQVDGKRMRGMVAYGEAASDDEFEEAEVIEISDHEDEEDIMNNPQAFKSSKQEFLLDKHFAHIFKEIKNLPLKNMFMQLRNICGSPYTYYEPFVVEDMDAKAEDSFMEILFRNSPKFQVLYQLLGSLLPNTHKVLIFSQFTKMLDLLQDWLQHEGISTCRLDGSTSQEEREVTIKDFNLGNKKQVFLLLTRAGGLGINLVAADTVIILDNDWNPQMDLQAIDRVHRIGQTKPVKIYRFLVKNSIEEILISKSYNKRFLERLVMQMGQFKFNKVSKLLDKDENLADRETIKEILALTQRFAVEQSDKRSEELFFLDQPFEPFRLTEHEMTELTNRDLACYESSANDFDNITVFETMNKMDQKS